MLFSRSCTRRNSSAKSGDVGRESEKPRGSVPPPAADRIRAHVKFLASDLLEGRGTGQRGGDIAAEYIGTQFASYGLQPAGDNGTFYQSVPMVSVKTLPSTSFKLVPKIWRRASTLKNLDDFVTNSEAQSELADIDAPIVFIGYGIKAPEYNWDDYKGVDLKGKVALVFVNEPSSDDPKFFKGKALTYYGRWTYKFEETARRGAVATLIIHRTDLASYGWQVVRNSWGSEREYLKREADTPAVQAASWIQLDVAKKLATMGGQDLDKLFAAAQIARIQAGRAARASASACRQRTAAVHRAQCGGDACPAATPSGPAKQCCTPRITITWASTPP